MKIQIKFFGAAQNVTGSCYLVEANDIRLLVDCGLYQERDLRSRNWDPFPIAPSDVDFVLLTHAHLDHCGRLPKLVKEGFRGKILGTPATCDIAEIILKDSAHIQEEDIKHKLRRHQKARKKSPFPYEALYTSEDVEHTLPLFEEVPYDEAITLGEGFKAQFFEAGHIFGSTMIKLLIEQNGEHRSILFSGDVGRWDIPIIEDPHAFKQADYVVMESTYGDRLHGKVASIPDELERVINKTHRAGGNVIIPSFAVERTQELLFHLSQLLREDRIPHLVTFVDSPMAISVTEVFRRHPEMFDEESRALLAQGQHPCDFSGLSMTSTVDKSKAINHIRGTSIIISGSGMCTGGRIKHHLKNNIHRPECTILFVGYQAYGTLGRHILEKPDKVRIHGEWFRVRAHVEKISGFSAHADRDELVRWISSLEKAPRKVFVTHGEEKSAHAFASHLETEMGWSCEVPNYMDEVVLD